MKNLFLLTLFLIFVQYVSFAQLKVTQDGVKAELSSSSSGETNGCMLINTNSYAVEVSYSISFVKKLDKNTQNVRKDKTVKLAADGTPRGNGPTNKFWVSAKDGLPVDFEATTVSLSVIKSEVQSAKSNKLGAHTEVILKNGKILYIEEIDNGIGPARGWKRDLLNKVNWPSGFASCATQHDTDYGTIGVSKNDADMKLKRCAESVYTGTIGDLIKQQGWTLRQFSTAIGFFDISEDMKFADVVHALMCNSDGNDSYKEGQRMAQTTEKYKKEVEEILQMSIDTKRYYFILSN